MFVIKEDVGDLQFAKNANLDYVLIEEDVERIGEKAFADCRNLCSIRIVEWDKPIKISLDYVKGCKNLVNISIERKVEFYKKIKYKGVKIWKSLFL